MSTLSHIDQYLRMKVIERYRRFNPTSIADLMSSSPRFRHISEDLPGFLLTNQKGVHQWFRRQSSRQFRENAAGFFVSHTLAYLYQHNQFLSIPIFQQRKLESIYNLLLRNYGLAAQGSKDNQALRQALVKIMTDHQTRLVHFVDDIAQHNGGLDFVLREPVCSSYSPQLQFALFGLEIDDLLEPVLDLGCGQDALLVRFLSNQGKSVIGIDRTANEASNVFKLDWFDFSFHPEQWGTIISHMAFSTHFLHHHLRRNGHPERYAKQYMMILQSLKVGGRFIYTPGLPFMETLLPPDQYQVHKWAAKHSGFKLQRADLTSGEVGYTTIVTRL